MEFNQSRAGVPNYLQGFGGDTSNAVIAAARAGVKTAYLTRLGSDRFGDMLLALWQREGVATQAIERDATCPTAIYFVHHAEAGHEFTYMRAGSAASRMTLANLVQGGWAQAVSNAKILHVSGVSLAISETGRETVLAAMRLARSAETKVSLDSNLRLQLWSLAAAQATIREAVGLSDLFLPSLEDMVALTGLSEAEAIVDWSHAHGAKSVVLKLGGDGALVSDGHRRERVAGRRVNLVDATGAGDCFCGNLLARFTMGDDIFAATQYANAAASISVQGYGAVAPLPTQAQVLARL